MSSSPELRLYNTLTRKKERFEPIDRENVRVYACGPTVYDHLHIGNGRMLVVFDVLFRLLRHLYGPDHVTYVRNITDVDDKINERAAERGIDIRALTDEMIAIFHADAKALGCLAPTLEPRATDHIAPMLEIIGRLIARGHAYAAEGHVLFDVPSDADYGKLSRRPLDEMIAGARVEVAPYKRSPTDFVLWKPSGPGEPAWDSPWGRGRPGWHLECSAMSWKHLGEIFDIHGGGIDLVFPHHENEIAQTCSAFGHDVMANYWVHNGHLQVEGEKMSKSTGNFVTIHELLHGWKGRAWPGRVARLALLETQYRQPIDFTYDRLEQALAELAWIAQECDPLNFRDRELFRRAWTSPPSGELIEALADDLNTPEALSVLKRNLRILQDGDDETRARILADSNLLGLLTNETLRAHQGAISMSHFSHVPASLAAKVTTEGFRVKAFAANNDVQMIETSRANLSQMGVKLEILPGGAVALTYEGSASDQSVEELIQVRLAARAAKNWQESDRIRDELAAMGIALKDNKDGTTTWEVKR
ncbi:MAG: cysteinyl-tRNA synthetase [Methylobacteriaceae bacterium]|nr:cysteinyl-tRNA synthetase [Methylobacteriaceae bacterium]